MTQPRLRVDPQSPAPSIAARGWWLDRVVRVMCPTRRYHGSRSRLDPAFPRHSSSSRALSLSLSSSLDLASIVEL